MTVNSEIDKNYYCSANEYVLDRHGSFVSCLASFGSGCKGCKNYHRKFPMPEEFAEEYGYDYPADGAVYLFEGANLGYTTKLFRIAKISSGYYIICACTPFGCPPEGWKPDKYL